MARRKGKGEVVRAGTEKNLIRNECTCFHSLRQRLSMGKLDLHDTVLYCSRQFLKRNSLKNGQLYRIPKHSMSVSKIPALVFHVGTSSGTRHVTDSCRYRQLQAISWRNETLAITIPASDPTCCSGKTQYSVSHPTSPSDRRGNY